MTISVIHCFDHNYVLPAAVAFQTLLEHAKTPGAVYDLHVLGSGITPSDRALLEGVVAKFPQGRLSFREPPPNPVPKARFGRKSHYSADLYYKLLVPELYPELDRAVLADVDAIWQDDVAQVWNALDNQQPTTNNQQPTPLIAGAWDPGYASYHRVGLEPTGAMAIRGYARKFRPDEVEKLRISAGLMVFDLKGLRREKMSEKWIAFARTNVRRAILPEQEPINILTADRIATLPLRFMGDAARYGHPRWRETYEPAVMLHYASDEKPWRFPDAPLADRWFDAAARAGVRAGRRKYDLVFSVGSTCACSQALRHAGLQFLSMPFDWVGGPSVLEKSRRICESFDGWFACDTFDLVTVPRYGRESYWRDRWGFTPIHDLNTSVPLEDQLPAVGRKYARRARRLLDLIDRSKRILVVQVDDPLFAPTDRRDVCRSQALLAAKWPDKVFHVLVLRNEDGVTPADRKTSKGEGWTEVSFGYVRHDDQPQGVADYRMIGDWLASEYDVVDYRTPEERRQATRKRRMSEYARMGAASFWGYCWNKVQYRLYKHLKKDMERRGIA